MSTDISHIVNNMKSKERAKLALKLQIEHEKHRNLILQYQHATTLHNARMALLKHKSRNYPSKFKTKARHTNIGKGRGTIKEQERVIYEMVDVYSEYLSSAVDYFKKFTQLTRQEFKTIVDGMEHRREWLLERTECGGMSFENRILLTMRWIVCYEMYKTIAEKFRTSEAYVSIIINETMPIVVEYFVTHIPHVCTTAKTSSLNDVIRYVIDATPTFIRKPIADQHLWYRRDKHDHFVSTHVLMDFDKMIVAMSVNYMGHNVDSVCARLNRPFEEIVGDKDLGLGDPGYQNVDFLVPGLEMNQRGSAGAKLFYKISYAEQKSIEHVNKFMKNCKSIAGRFRHDHMLLSGCLLVCGGLYNMKRKLGHFTSLDRKIKAKIDTMFSNL